MVVKISIVTDKSSWINAYIPTLRAQLQKKGHGVRWIHDDHHVQQGDLAFYLSYGKIVGRAILQRNTHNLVVHESDLPKGKGWSPVTWQVLKGRKRIPVTLFEAVEALDAGPIYLKTTFALEGHELIDEIRRLQAEKTLALCTSFVQRYPGIVKQATPQRGRSTFYARRRAEDSRLDPRRSLRAQFNLLRVVDNEKYPAFFEFRRHRYRLAIAKIP